MLLFCFILFYVILFQFYFVLAYFVLIAPNKSHSNGLLCIHLQPGTCVSPPGGRTRPPTCLVEGKSNLPLHTATKRRHEILVAAARIHGGSENNPTPALDGMFETLNKRRKLDTMKDYVLSNDKIKDKLVSSVYKGNVRSFETSPTNVKRSIATFYSSGIMGKRKYNCTAIRNNHQGSKYFIVYSIILFTGKYSKSINRLEL